MAAVRLTPDAREEQMVNVSPPRRKHILDGDATGGGHGPGRNISGKSEFPSTLTDDEIIAGVEAIANDPASYPGVPTSRSPGAAGRRRVVLHGVIKGVDTAVVVVPPPGGEIITAWPVGVPRNP
ncbi:MAG TPA: EndoU domain-containing protein [Pirellulales bacterium]|nr:EndoU domain-containing protein [Pirellulales bacterium]